MLLSRYRCSSESAPVEGRRTLHLMQALLLYWHKHKHKHKYKYESLVATLCCICTGRHCGQSDTSRSIHQSAIHILAGRVTIVWRALDLRLRAFEECLKIWMRTPAACNPAASRPALYVYTIWTKLTQGQCNAVCLFEHCIIYNVYSFLDFFSSSRIA